MKLPNFLERLINKRIAEIKASIFYKVYLYLDTTIRLKLYLKKTDTKALSKSYKKITGEGWVILHYQRICNPKEVPFALANHSYIEEKTFKKHCSWLKQEAEVIPLNQLIDHIENNTPIPSRSVIITFENGFLDGYARGAQHLIDYNLPATYSIPTAYIGTNSYLLYDLISILCNTLYLHKVPFPSLIEVEKDLDGVLLPTLDRNQLPSPKTHMALITICYGLNKGQRAKLFEKLDILVKEYDLELPPWRDFMNWQEVEKISEAGFQIINQLHSNPWITLLSKKELEQELDEADKLLTKLPTYKKDLTSFPYGIYSDSSINNLEKLGMHYGLAYNMGPSVPDQRALETNNKFKILSRLNVCESNTHSRELFFSRLWGLDLQKLGGN